MKLCPHNAKDLIRINAMYNFKILCTKCCQYYITWQPGNDELLLLWKKGDEIEYDDKKHLIGFQNSKCYQELLQTYNNKDERKKYFTLLKSKRKISKNKYNSKNKKSRKKL